MEEGIEDKIPGVWKKNFNFSPTKREIGERMLAPASSRGYGVSDLAMAG